jgi:hypothetical protein
MNFKTRLVKLERWLARRCCAVKALEFTSVDNVYGSQTWVNVLVVVIQATHASLRTIHVYLGQRDCTRVATQRGSVLAFSRAINQCQSLTHLRICFLEEHSLYALGQAALPQSLQRLKLLCAPGARQFRLNEVKVLDLARLRGLPHLTSVVLGPQFPLTCFVPVGLSRLTELDIDSWGGVVFQEGLGMPGLQRLVLVLHNAQNHVRLPALQGLPGLTELRVNNRVLVPRDLTPLRLLRKFCHLARGVQELPRTPVLPESLTLLQAAGGLQAFPEQALALWQLTYLDVSNNYFSALPAGVTVLSNLQYLALGLSTSFAMGRSLHTLGILDAVALGDLSAFPCLTVLGFSYCQVALSHDFGVRHHAPLDKVLFVRARPCQGSSAAALLALHRQLLGSGHRGVECSGLGSTEVWVELADEYA